MRHEFTIFSKCYFFFSYKLFFFSDFFSLFFLKCGLFFLNFRFCFTADRVKIYTNEEKTRWVFPLGPVISRRFSRIKIGRGECVLGFWPCLLQFSICLCFNRLYDYKGDCSQI